MILATCRSFKVALNDAGKRWEVESLSTTLRRCPSRARLAHALIVQLSREDSMEYRRLGRSGLFVSALTLGTMTFGGRGAFSKVGSTDVAGARRHVDMCLEAGVNLFDTANIYSGGESEELLGEAIVGRRDELLLATKVRMSVGEGPNDTGLSRHHIIRQCEDSLRRLVHIQDRFRAMSYGNEHETSYLRTYAFSGGARGARGRSSLLRSLRTPPLPDTFSQCSRRARTTDSQKPGVRTANSARRHPRLQQARAGCSQSDLLATHRGLHAAFDEQSALSLRELLHRSPREFGRQSTLWTLKDAAEVTFEEGLTNELVSGETIRATLSRLGVRWERAKRWIESPDPEYARKRGSRPADPSRREPSTVGFGLRGRDLVFSLRATCSAFLVGCHKADTPS